jgi:hypothetical protein
MRPRAKRAAALALVAGVAWVGSASGKRTAQRSPSSCVHLTQESSDRAITFRLDNACDEELACEVELEVRCDGGGLHAWREEPTLPAHDGASVTASAKECGDAGWTIAPARWTCRRKVPLAADRK